MARSAVPGASNGADRRNRAGLLLVGLLLAGAGAYGLGRGWDSSSSEPLLGDGLRRFVDRNLVSFWAVTGVVALLLAIIGLRWLRGQLADASPRRLDLTHRGDRGVTVIGASGAGDALAADIERYAGVAGASARLTGDEDAPDVDLRVDVAEAGDVPALRARIEDDALPRFRRALDLEDVSATIEFRLSSTPAGPRVR